MPFAQTSITDGPLFTRQGTELLISWGSSAPAGTVFQLYKDRRLAWWGTALRVIVPLPKDPALYEVGTVAAYEGATDFSGSLPALGGTGNRATLTWTSGTYQGAALAGFHIYGESGPNAGVNLVTPVATVPGWGAGVVTDGYGCGGYGLGRYGLAASTYSWTSGPLAKSGTWHWAVVPFDSAGNPGTTQLFAVPVTVAPGAPPPNGSGQRLTYSYVPATQIATLSWLASPGS